MRQVTQFIAGLVTLAVAGTAAPAFAASRENAERGARPSLAGALDPLSPAEVSKFESTYPDKAKLVHEAAAATRSRTAGTSAIREGAYVRIRNWNSDKCLAIGSSSTDNGAHAIQWDYTGSNGQRWY
ncbi:RICIN domain-containing protein [Streptomyces roseirectus]|uniref:RICIN domain-containing protein n=1 Tax=Streptomyces roseirectus TaxID=2768066 RepID=A0A7H0IQP3_9ACTN|nr:RICIN domain-containing protein [Streptomyces roseirectus]QNP75109.1 RICIN domain-containing protein [Streptomyces roseirectus]